MRNSMSPEHETKRAVWGGLTSNAGAYHDTAPARLRTDGNGSLTRSRRRRTAPVRPGQGRNRGRGRVRMLGCERGRWGFRLVLRRCAGCRGRHDVILGLGLTIAQRRVVVVRAARAEAGPRTTAEVFQERHCGQAALDDRRRCFGREAATHPAMRAAAGNDR